MKPTDKERKELLIELMHLRKDNQRLHDKCEILGREIHELRSKQAQTLPIDSGIKCDCSLLVSCIKCGERKGLDGDFWKNYGEKETQTPRDSGIVCMREQCTDRVYKGSTYCLDHSYDHKMEGY